MTVMIESEAYPEITAEAASRLLEEAGIHSAASELKIEPREGRVLVCLPANRIAWFPVSLQGRSRLNMERHILRALAQRCSFSVPEILYESQSGFDVRVPVQGLVDPFGVFERLKSDSSLAKSIGREIGAILLEQHTRIRRHDVKIELPKKPSWPLEASWILERLPSVTDDAILMRRATRVLEIYEDVRVNENDVALVHGDFGFHNFALDPHTFTINGVFDYDGAAWADRHHDFRYLVFHIPTESVFRGALEVYEGDGGQHVDQSRVYIYNAICAVSFLAYRDGVPPEKNWCGRTLAEDLEWTNSALARLS